MALLEKIVRSNYLVFIFAALCGLALIYRVVSMIGRFQPDLSVFYFSLQGAFHGISPYHNTALTTGVGYPVVTLLLFLPVLFIPFKITETIFVLLNALSLIAIIFLCLKILNKLTPLYFSVFLFLSLISFPVAFTFGLGQVNLIAYFFLIYSFYSSEQNFAFRSSLFLTLAVILKPILGFMIVYFLLKRKWRIVMVSLILDFVGVLVSIFLFGIQNYQYYIFTLVPHLMNLKGREVYYNQGFTGFIARITPSIVLRRYIPTVTSFILISIATALHFVQKIPNTLLFSVLLTILVFSDTLSWQHHFVFLIFPFIVFFFILPKKDSRGKILLMLSYLLVSYNFKNPGGQYGILLSHAFIGLILLMGLLYAFCLKGRVKQSSVFVFVGTWSVVIVVVFCFYLLCRGGICI